MLIIKLAMGKLERETLVNLWSLTKFAKISPIKVSLHTVNTEVIPDSRITLVLLVEYTLFLETSTRFRIVEGPSPSYDH